MSELHHTTLLQQHSAQPIPGSYLESMGKNAAASWASGQYKTLTEAVVHAIKHASAHLCPEQALRVTEFANTDAYLTEFRKEGQAHKIIHFDGGPANPADVLRDLNAGGGTTVFDSGLGDYAQPPTKTASAEEEAQLAELFQVKHACAYPEENPYGELHDVRAKLAGLYEHVSAQVDGVEALYHEAAESLYNEVKQASLQGTSLGEVLQAWEAVSPEPVFVKAAFDQFTPRFFQEQLFDSLDDMGESLMKVGSVQLVNSEHPLVGAYHDFCTVLSKLASLRGQQEEVQGALQQADRFLGEVMRKEAEPVQLLPLLNKGQRHVADFMRNRVGLGEGASKLVGAGVAKGLPAAALLGTGKYMADAAIDSGVAAHVPLPNNPYYEQMRMMRAQGGY